MIIEEKRKKWREQIERIIESLMREQPPEEQAEPAPGEQAQQDPPEPRVKTLEDFMQ